MFLAWALDEDISIWWRDSLVSSWCEWIWKWSNSRSGPIPEWLSEII